jgi:hypothetical protein
MQEHQKQNSGARRRPQLWLAAAGILALLGAATAGYATDGFTAWPWTMTIGEEGIIRDENGNIVGQTTTRIGATGESLESMKGKKVLIGHNP